MMSGDLLWMTCFQRDKEEVRRQKSELRNSPFEEPAPPWWS
jgi:hypothetical protein